MPDRTATIEKALDMPLKRIVRELNKCSPVLLLLIKLACGGWNPGEQIDPDIQASARGRLGEAVDYWTNEAQEGRRTKFTIRRRRPS